MPLGIACTRRGLRAPLGGFINRLSRTEAGLAHVGRPVIVGIATQLLSNFHETPVRLNLVKNTNTITTMNACRSLDYFS